MTRKYTLLLPSSSGLSAVKTDFRNLPPSTEFGTRDYIVAGCEDGSIVLWLYEAFEAVDVNPSRTLKGPEDGFKVTVIEIADFAIFVGRSVCRLQLVWLA